MKNWKDNLIKYCDAFDTHSGHYLEEKAVIYFIESLLQDYKRELISKVSKYAESFKIEDDQSLGYQRGLERSINLLEKL